MKAWSEKKVQDYVGDELYPVWEQYTGWIEGRYQLKRVWHTANRGEDVELKFRSGERTLVSLFPKFPEKEKIGVMLIFGKAEKERFEAERESFSSYVQKVYDESKIFYDGKWMMFTAPEPGLEEDFTRLLDIKRRPDKKK